MTPHPPYRLSARDRSTAGGLRPARARGSYDPSGYRVLTVFVHGYNNSEYRALARWDDHTWPSLAKLTRSPVDGVVLFFWPGDSHTIKMFSSPQYPRRVRTAIEAGVELGEYLRRIADRNPGLQVQFVGHSLGCRVVLSAVYQLAEQPQVVPVVRVLLMGAAVPEGDCTGHGPWPDRLAALFPAVGGQNTEDVREVVLHSRDDGILRRMFPAGELAARQLGEVVSFGSHAAVGLTGGPRDRWSGEADSCGLDHDDYPKHAAALRHVAALFGPLIERRPAEHADGGRSLEEQRTDVREPEYVPHLG